MGHPLKEKLEEAKQRPDWGSGGGAHEMLREKTGVCKGRWEGGFRSDYGQICVE